VLRLEDYLLPSLGVEEHAPAARSRPTPGTR
jgi:hypothetical protein